MQYKKDVKKVAFTLPEGVSWKEVLKLMKIEKYQNLFHKIDPKTLKFSLEESNRPKVIKALIKALKKTDPQNGTKEYAEKIIEAIREVARMILEQKNEK